MRADTTVTVRPRVEVVEVYTVLRDFLAWSKDRPDRAMRMDDYIAVWHACDQIQRQKWIAELAGPCATCTVPLCTCDLPTDAMIDKAIAIRETGSRPRMSEVGHD